MLLADVGRKYHALLTAHLSPEGNELDIFFETADDQNPIPVAIPVEPFTAQAKVSGEEQPKELEFEPAPQEERPTGEKPGACSHFVAKAPWMRADNTLNVVVFLTLEGERYRVTWEQFNPKKSPTMRSSRYLPFSGLPSGTKASGLLPNRPCIPWKAAACRSTFQAGTLREVLALLAHVSLHADFPPVSTIVRTSMRQVASSHRPVAG
jgi:hypothetical protein